MYRNYFPLLALTTYRRAMQPEPKLAAATLR
jgi:hypothetical protein